MPVKIDYKKCNVCGMCYEVCPVDVFERDDALNLYQAAYNDDCWHCGICILDCPTDAIELTMPFACL